MLASNGFPTVVVQEYVALDRAFRELRSTVFDDKVRLLFRNTGNKLSNTSHSLLTQLATDISQQ